LADWTSIFFPKPQVLEETERDHRQQYVMVQSMPVPALTMIEPQLFLHLLVPLLTDPARLDGGHQFDQGGLGRMIGQVILAFVGAPLTNQPDLGPGKWRPVRNSGPSATRTRTAAKSPFMAPLVPARQDTR